jgi:hypothetical protein
MSEEIDAQLELIEKRIYRRMVYIVAISGVVSLAFASVPITLGVIVGGALSLLNFRWLQASVRAIFPADNKAPSATGAAKFLLRYFILAGTLFIAYRFEMISLVAVLVGLLSFVPAALMEAFVQAISALALREDK